jgi:hypothetical protein
MTTTMINQPVGLQMVAGTDPTAALAPPDLSMIPMTPDGIMAFCAGALNHDGAVIQQYMQNQQKANADSDTINSVIAKLDQYGGGFLGDDAGANKAAAGDIQATIQAAIDKVGANTEAGAKLTELLKNVQATGIGAQGQDSGNDGFKISSDEIKAFTDQAKNIQSSLNSNSEVNMIQLQSLASDRQTKVSLATNLIQSIDDTVKSVANNIGH